MLNKIKPWILTTMEGGNAKALSGTMLAGQEHAGMTLLASVMTSQASVVLT